MAVRDPLYRLVELRRTYIADDRRWMVLGGVIGVGGLLLAASGTLLHFVGAGLVVAGVLAMSVTIGRKVRDSSRKS